ncbi:hypothetical protein PVAG01_10045 [Phlyctema vagabunda]|uniref:Zn(2)-C6 fungal-type domain-containing protein n=1 Tax=Phlyctema vagabunda TaxID=108571 RepID=A0ABR4P4U1_9HELO
MLIHQSTTRRKACTCCVKAKRRCNLVLPRCARCTSKGLSCRYVDDVATLQDRRRRKPAVTQPVPELTPPLFEQNLSSILFPDEDFDVSRTTATGSDFERILYDLTPLNPCMPPGSVQVPVNQVNYCVMKLKKCVDTLVLENRTTFMHPSSYEDRMPPAYQDVLSICSLHRAKTSCNQHQVSKMLDLKLEALITASETDFWTVDNVLLSLQALILYQIIRIFDGNAQQMLGAEQHFKLLGAWTDRLRQCYSEAEQSSLFRTPYEQWVLLESIRRTILTSVLLRGVYAILKTGYCDQVPLLEVLPVSTHGGMWKMAETNWWEETVSGRGLLHRYIDFVHEWNEGKVAYVEDYEKCLLVKTRGVGFDESATRSLSNSTRQPFALFHIGPYLIELQERHGSKIAVATTEQPRHRPLTSANMRRTCRLFAAVKPARYLESGTPTGLTGLFTHHAPRATLLYVYSSTLEKLKEFPESSLYRTSTEAITKQRLEIVKSVVPEGHAEWVTRAKKIIAEHPEVFNTPPGGVDFDGGRHVKESSGGQVFIQTKVDKPYDEYSTEWDGEVHPPVPEGTRTTEERAYQKTLGKERPGKDLKSVKWEHEPPLTAEQIEDIETRIGAGLIEEVIQVAEGELKLVDVLLNSKVWEDLEEKPVEGQWTYFTRDTATPPTQAPPQK